jgi:hypothetical protein
MNPMDLFKNIQNMQSKVSEIQEKMKDIRVTGSAGGDMVTVEMNGQMAVLDVKISPEAVDPQDVEMLEDLIQAAMVNATSKVKEKLQEEMSALTGGMPLPPGMLGLG